MGALGKAGVGVFGIAQSLELLEDMKPEEASYRVTADTDYAVYVEFGTKSQEAQPFMRRATNQAMRNAGSYMEEADDVDEFVELLAENIAERAERNAPVDTGTLQNSITVEQL